ncbi:MAG: helix-turn-helix domain-containing protein [Oscillospiraceae bacterium]|nr:helix-turn-helix domain-containing protein [Oscillospiraceae bacterium]
MYREVFSQRLKKARENTGFTQREVSRDTGISQPSIAQYETGAREPDIETMGRLAEFYGVSVDWLLGMGGKNNFDLDGIPRIKNSVSLEMRANIQDSL